MKFSIKDFFSKYGQIRSFLRIWPHLLKKPSMENFIFWVVIIFSIWFWKHVLASLAVHKITVAYLKNQSIIYKSVHCVKYRNFTKILGYFFLCLSEKFPHQEIRWNYGILRSGVYLPILQGAPIFCAIVL